MKTSWQSSSRWYSRLSNDSGHYFHQHLIIPGVLKLLRLNTSSKLLDLGCGNGVLARSIPAEVSYTGIDIAPALIKDARLRDKNSCHQFIIADVTKLINLTHDFTHAVFILSLQNISNPAAAIRLAAQTLVKQGKLVIVLNHPCFRIPRQSSWGVDEANHLEYRRINRYLSPLEIPIVTHPGKAKSAVTWSFHQPLSAYVNGLSQSGLLVDQLEEWISDKTSHGAHAKRENFSRREFPLFLTLRAVKV